MGLEQELNMLPSGIKVKITTPSMIRIACPICGEGKSKHKTRGYILGDGNRPATYFCHNDSGCNRSYAEFLDFNGGDGKAYLSTFRKALFKKVLLTPHKPTIVTAEAKAFIEDVNNTDKTPFGFKLSLKEVPSKTITFTYNSGASTVPIIPLVKSKEAVAYMKGRNIPETTYKELLFAPRKKMLIIPMLYHGKMYAWQARSITTKTFHNEVWDDNPRVYGLEAMWEASKAKKPLYIFESVFNAYSTDFDYCAAFLGTTIPSNIINELYKPETVMCLDMDEKGINESIKYVKRGFNIVYHGRDGVDYNDMAQEGDSREVVSKFITDHRHASGLKTEFKLRLNR